ncbi:MAG TPA: hypothetical protein VKW08_17430 [Xanthobacteraceae bacterium]|jgi:hypothetical protein|nr:hypothetical protein [Xanthobacteraceae bacterium]
MIRSTGLVLLLSAVVVPALAQQQHVSYKTSSENAKYVQQLNVEVGDVPNHIVRAFDLHRTHPDGPVINGSKLVEESVRGMTELSGGSGSSTVYGIYTLANGDKFFARILQVNQNADGKVTATGIGPITGGTGKLADMHGVVSFVVNFDVKSGFNEGKTDIDYILGK